MSIEEEYAAQFEPVQWGKPIAHVGTITHIQWCRIVRKALSMLTERRTLTTGELEEALPSREPEMRHAAPGVLAEVWRDYGVLRMEDADTWVVWRPDVSTLLDLSPTAHPTWTPVEGVSWTPGGQRYAPTHLKARLERFEAEDTEAKDEALRNKALDRYKVLMDAGLTDGQIATHLSEAQRAYLTEVGLLEPAEEVAPKDRYTARIMAHVVNLHPTRTELRNKFNGQDKAAAMKALQVLLDTGRVALLEGRYTLP